MKNILFTVMLVSSWVVSGHAQTYITEAGEAVFLSKAPINKFEGKSSALKGMIDVEKNMIDFYLDLNTLKTGIKLRDKHMRENYLETQKYPFAEFTGKITTPEVLANATSKTQVSAQGLFKIHGVEKEIIVKGFLERLPNDQWQLEASFEVLLTDYNIERPSVVFYELADKQLVTIAAILIPHQP